MGEDQEPDTLEGAPGDTPPDGTQDGQADAGQGKWSPEVQAAVTQMRQRDRQELAEERKQMRQEFDERLAEMREQRRQPAPTADPGEPSDPAVVDAADRAFRSTPTYRALQQNTVRLQQLLAENSIEGGLDALRGEPFFEEVEDEVRSRLRRIASDPSGPPLSRSSARFVYLDRVYPRLTKALASAKSEAEKIRGELKEKLSQANAPGSVSGASSDVEGPELTDDEISDMLETSSEEEFAKILDPNAR